MKYTIEVDDSEMELLFKQKYAENIVHMSRETMEVRKAVSDAVRDVIYTNKDMIVDRAVNQAADELVRKGLKRLVSAMTNGD
jgi:hypothetical protein